MFPQPEGQLGVRVDACGHHRAWELEAACDERNLDGAEQGGCISVLIRTPKTEIPNPVLMPPTLNG
jgi:hypothetical protein